MQDSMAVPIKGKPVKGQMQDVVYEDQAQYDAPQDFGIFGVGNKTVGGVQNLKEKMNMADDKDSSDDEEDI
jgi:hypothetical protein